MIYGVAWSHRRCWGPLDATAASYSAKTGEQVHWNRRSLFSFGEDNLNGFVDTNDLIIFDHPFTGDIAQQGILLDLKQFLSADEIQMLEQNKVGASYESYKFDNGIWGLPIDAAATTAAWRPDLMAAASLEIPQTLEDVKRLAIEARTLNKWVGWAAKPTDLFCTYLSMLASLGAPAGQNDEAFVSREMNNFVIDQMRSLIPLVHPKSAEWNPIQILNHMAHNDDILYVPYTFNYVNYSTDDEGSIRFGSSPQMQKDLPARGLLGGAGIGVSAKSQNPRAAFEYAMSLVNPDFQASEYVIHGGQPGMRSAWTSTECDKITNDFFSNCLQAMDDAYLRPTLPGFVNFFHEGTLRLSEVVNDGASSTEFWSWLIRYYEILQRGAEEQAYAIQKP
ncbi:MAG: extracellular solute-binding protein [Rhizobiales bacterium]|nr:ABC transporter substrate-binding protein [Hyphomicrobiales bacterium]NRB15455.1 extracellular solute-binding protein [Hyphomicrobiales bacterium]